MSPKKFWVSLRRLKVHEFNTTLRHIKRTGVSWHDIFLRLGELVSQNTKGVVKQSSSLLVYYLAISTFGTAERVSVTFQGTTASVPTAFVSIIASVTFFLLAVNLQSVIMLMVIRAQQTARIRLHGFSSNTYGLFYGQDELALTVPIVLNQFLSPRTPVPRLLAIIYSSILFTVLLPVAAMWVFLIKTQWGILANNESTIYMAVVAAFGIAVLVATLAFVFLFNIPFPYSKNSFGIRWGFLSRLVPIGTHPQLSGWLAEEEAKNKARKK